MSHDRIDQPRKEEVAVDEAQTLEISSVAVDGCQEDDDISRLSFGDNKSYIVDLAAQKRNRRQRNQQEALEETEELYEIALEKGAEKSKELFLALFQQVEPEVRESYKEKDKLVDERLKAALKAEIDKKQNSKPHPTSSEVEVIRLDERLKNEETKILEKKIAKLTSLIQDIQDSKNFQSDETESTQLLRLQKKHGQCNAELRALSDTATLSQAPTLLESALKEINRATIVKSDSIEEMDYVRTSLDTSDLQRQPDTSTSPESSPRLKASIKSSEKVSPYGDMQYPRSSSPIGANNKVEPRISLQQREGGIHSPESVDTATTTVHTVTKKFYSIQDFQNGTISDDQVNMSKWEEYLKPLDFEKYFGMSKPEFGKMPMWKQKNVKRQLRTW